MMDPLAPAGWPGEWIRGRDLRAFAWSTPSGGLSALMTPAAPRTFTGVRLGGPRAAAGVDGLSISWPVVKAPAGLSMPRLDVPVKVPPATDALLPPGPAAVSGAPAASAARGHVPAVALAQRIEAVAPAPIILDSLPLAPGRSATIETTIATPTAAGHWALMLDVVDDIDGSFAAHGSRPGAILVDLVETIAGLTPVAVL